MVALAVATIKRNQSFRKESKQNEQKTTVPAVCMRFIDKPAVAGTAALAAVVFIKTCFTMAFSRQSFATAMS
jgi:hypothetical protein